MSQPHFHTEQNAQDSYQSWLQDIDIPAYTIHRSVVPVVLTKAQTKIITNPSPIAKGRKALRYRARTNIEIKMGNADRLW